MIVGIQKRGGIVVLLGILLGLFILPDTFAGYCGNAAESSYYCIEADDDDCCPESATYYGVDGAPQSRADCKSNYYDATDTTVNGFCSVGCCYSATDHFCDSSATAGECEYVGDAFDETGCSAISQCTEGCCVYDDGTGTYTYVLSSSGYCTGLLEAVNGDFEEGETDAGECAGLAAAFVAVAVECDDDVDNDGDGATDYPADSGCASIADSSETDPEKVCNDLEDNDGDGYVDLDDGGCCASTETANERLCELDPCGKGDELTTTCNCYYETAGIAEAQGTLCASGNYCVDGVCQSTPAGAECSPGEKQICAYEVVDDVTCVKYETCESNSFWSTCTRDPSCGVTPEVCTDSDDNDGDALVDCQDLDCYATKCGTTSDHSNCEEYGTYGYWSGTDDSYLCCSTENVNDCDSDGTPETCGSCDCLGVPLEAAIDAVDFTLGKKQLTVEWTLACAVNFRLRRCTGDDCPTTVSDLSSEDIESAFTTVSGGEKIDGAWEFTDTTIEAKQRYCYVVEALYEEHGPDNTFSEPYCVDDSGDAWCQKLSTSEFCLDDDDGMSERLVSRVSCTDQNKMSYEDCSTNEICVGPYSDGTTACVDQSNCETCGDPLGLYAIFYGIVDFDALYGSEIGDGFCYELPTCYFDYTLTTINNFHECAEVSSCYNYASESACGGQVNENGRNNKCLQRDCTWVDLTETSETGEEGIPQGLCKEKNADYARCDLCNNAVRNGIFDACTVSRCQEFSVDSATCYLDKFGLCTDIGEFTCAAYEDAKSCRGDHNVVINSETNAVDTPSDDALSLGLCYWNGDTCYKDANGDEEMDAGQEDMTPPTTTILSSEKLRAINITLLSTDFDADGSTGDGVKELSYCIVDAEEDACYPDTLVELDEQGIGTIEEGEGSGAYILYYYAEDYAENLEVVQFWNFEVDKQGPVITLSYSVIPDTSEQYDDSALLFEANLDEEAYCTDSFETGAQGIDNEFNEHFVTKFSGLSDGWYIYSIECTDTLGNTGDAFVFANIDADSALFDAAPQQYVDSDEVTLTLKTFEDATCGFSENTEEEKFAGMDEGFEAPTNTGDYYLHSRDWTLDQGNGLYYFDVKCEFDDGSVSDDEIQFVYDDTPPETALVDSFGNALDVTGFYQGEDVDIYLGCTDEPEYGFGCHATYYCIDTELCTPETFYDPTKSISYDGESTQLYLCYSSVENTFAEKGGLEEDIQCTELTLDYYDPTLTLTAPADEAVVYVPYVPVSGTVDDADAAIGTAMNTVTAILKTTTGEEITFTNIDARDGTFSYTIENLTLETNSTSYNTLTIYATDRSGATSATETIRVLYTIEAEGDAIWVEEPNNGVSDTSTFTFVIGTFLEAEKCGYSKNDASLEKSVAMTAVASDIADEHQYGAPYSISTEKNGIPEYVYVKCKLVNGVTYNTTLTLEYDSTAPVIEDLYLANSDGKTPPSIIEEPLDPVLVVVTDDQTQCKYSINKNPGFSYGMTWFNAAQEEYFTENNITLTGLNDLSAYTVYVACQNGAYAISTSEELGFTINSSAASGMYLIAPEASGSRTFNITIGTTRQATSCQYATTSEKVAAETGTAITDIQEGRQWKTGSITVSADGVYTYYFGCWFVEGYVTDFFTLSVDTTAPDIVWIEDGNFSTTNTTLSAAWQANDSLTKIVGYKYSVGKRAGYNDTYQWTETTEEEAVVGGLDLENQSTYYWNVKAVNEVGLWSTVESSDGVFIDTAGSGTNINAKTVAEVEYHPCSNGVQDEDETDTDCGGSCDACEAGSACEVDDDCSSLNCAGSICQESTCTDTIKNQGESDLDCGGNYCDGCAVGYTCVYNNDCASLYCEGKTCTAPTCTDKVENGNETGIDCGGSCTALCEEVDLNKEPLTKAQAKKLAWYWWTVILLLVVGASVGGYYGYQYYRKKKGFGKLSGFGLPALQRPLLRRVIPAAVQQRMQQLLAAKQRADAEKQKAREKVFGAFEERKPQEKLLERKPTGGAQVKTPTGKKEEKLVLKKPTKEKTKTFTALEKLIEERKK